MGRARIVAGVWYKKSFVSIATNSYKSHPVQKKFSGSDNKICLHAEVDAVLKARKLLGEKRLKHAMVYVARAKYKDGKMVAGLAKPCVICQEVISTFGMKVKFTYDN